MSFKQKNYTTYIALIIILIVVAFLSNRYTNKLNKEKDVDTYSSIRKYLLTDSNHLSNTGKHKKPIIWIPINYEYNSRNWISWGSRSSFDLNQPYMYLTVKSIINQCSDSFHICLIDDNSFSKLLPDWSVNMKIISSPVIDNIIQIGLLKVLYKYGGFIVPPSF